MGMLTIRDLSVVAGEPRVHDIVLGERLGFGRARDVRHVINRNFQELRRYGEVSRQVVAKPAAGSKGGRPKAGFMLNEGQALLVCMFSQTEKAADVRQQVIEVFMAWRAGELRAAPKPKAAQRLDAPVPESDPRHPSFRDPLAPFERRLATLDRMMAFDGREPSEALLRMLTQRLAPSGKSTRIRWPRFFHDKPVLMAVLKTHRQAEIAQVAELLKANFGYRAPSRSALARFWLRLDGLFGTGRKLH